MNRDREIIKHIFGKGTHVTSIKTIRHHGSSRIAVARITHPTATLVLKSYAESKITHREFGNLLNANSIPGVKTPKCFGYHQDTIVEEYLRGKIFQNIINANPRKHLDDLFVRSIENLAEIHSSFSKIKDKKAVRNIFDRKRAEERIEESLRMIREEGFESYEKLVGIINPSWQKALAAVDVEKLVKNLGVTSRNFVLGHGDYKPNNLIFTKDGLIYTLDWLNMSKSQPWYDLAYLLVSVPWKRKEIFVDAYLKNMKKRGFLKNVRGKEAYILFKSGAIFQEIIRARSNSHRMESVKNRHNISQFKAAMDGLCEILLD